MSTADSATGGSEETERGENETDLLVREGDIAGDYVEKLLDILDLDGDIEMDVANGRATVAVVGEDLSRLVGQRGVTLDALQELTRRAVEQQTGLRSRLMLDVGGFREQRREELGALARRTAEQVLADGDDRQLEPMNPFERKIVHDVIAGIDGVTSESEGVEPSRCVVVIIDD